MTDELLAYLLDDLSDDRRAAVEARLAEDAAWRREYERLKKCLTETNDPQACAEEPPGDLLERTCGLVRCAERVLHEAKVSPHAGVAALTATCEPAAAKTGRWSFADYTVCMAVLGVLGMLMLPALRESRDAARRQVCQARLGALGAVLFQYQENHGRRLPIVNPGEPAGIFAVKLAERAGVRRAELEELLVCPDSEEAMRRFSGEATPHIPTRAELAAARGARRALLIRTMGGSIAYRIGYFDDQGRYRVQRFTGSPQEPVSADAPSVSRTGIQSVNHGGGQNVLDQSLRVTFRTHWFWDADGNIFLNFAGRPAAGDDDRDVVLSRSDYGPEGPMVELRAE